MSHRRIHQLILAILATAGILGCDDDRDRLIEQARENASQQAAQNIQMAETARRAAEATQRAIEAQAQTRQDWAKAQEGFDRQRSDIEAERQQIAARRHRDPIIAGAISGAAILLTCLVPAVLAIYMLRSAARDPAESAQLAELLILEMTSVKPVLLGRISGPPALGASDPPALPPR